MADNPKKRKRKVIYITSNRNQNRNKIKNQLLNSIQLPTANRFAALQNSSDANAMDTGEQQQQTTTTKKVTIAPIVVTDHTTDIQAILKELKLENCNLKINSVGRKILPNTAEEKKKIEDHLKTKKIYYFTHPDNNTKVFKVVLSGLPQVDTNDIIADLTTQNVTPTKVTMFNTQSQNKLYLVHFDAEQVNKKTLDGIKYVYHHVIKWQTYKPKRNGPTQCHKCLMWGHGIGACGRYTVCMLCAGAHLTSECTVHKKTNDPNSTNVSFTCFNCKSANLPHTHKANDVNCPFRAKYESARNNSRTKTPTNNRTQTNTTRFVQAPPPPPLRTSFADSMRASASTSSRTQHSTSTSTNNTHSHARTNTNTRFNNTATHSTINDNDSTNVNNKWSFQECSNILFDSIERLQQCRTKLDQLKVIADLLKHACN